MSKYIDPFSDIGFKNLFGKEGQSEEILRGFLNEVFRGQPRFEEIKEIRYINNERSKEREQDKTIIHDVMCTTDSGHRFIVEMQKGAQENFMLRALYYVSRGVTDQALRQPGEAPWTYRFMPVVGVYLTAFKVEGMPAKVVTHIGLADMDTGELVNAHMRFVFLQMPYFNKKEEECKTKLEQIIYTLKNMPSLLAIPFSEYEGDFFSRLDSAARYSSLSGREKIEYDMEMKKKWDRAAELETALHQGEAKGREEGREEGRKEGREEGRKEGREEEKRLTAKNFKALGVDIVTIAKATGLSEEEIKKL